MRMPSKAITTTLAGLLAGTIYTGSVSAMPITCGVNTTEDATANGAFADDCHYENSNIASAAGITSHVNTTWGGGFDYVGKDGEAGDVAGFSLTVGAGSGGYEFSYALTVPTAWEGKTVDWVLGVKQANDSYVTYFFEDVILGIDGLFNNFWINPSGKEVNDYSFISGFIRPVSVAEPGTLLLMGLGLLGLGLAWASKRSGA